MFTLPKLELDEVHMRIDALGRLVLCKEKDEAALARVSLGIKAESTEEWEITSIHLGTQELRQGTEIYRRFAQDFEATDDRATHEHVDAIHRHVINHLPDVRDDAAFEDSRYAEAL